MSKKLVRLKSGLSAGILARSGALWWQVEHIPAYQDSSIYKYISLATGEVAELSALRFEPVEEPDE